MEAIVRDKSAYHQQTDERMNRHQLPEPLSGLDSTIAVRKLKPSNPIATTRMAIAKYGDVKAWGWTTFP